MGVTTYQTTDNLAVKLWAKRLAVEALKATWFQKFVGSTEDNLVQLRDDSQKSAGDKITYGLRMQLTGQGVQGDGTLEGNEESLATYSDALVISQLRHAVRSNGRMSQQRVMFNLREECLGGLRDWWSDRMDYSFFNQICGNTAQTNTNYTGLQATIAPDSAHQCWPVGSGITTDQGLGSTNTFSINQLDTAVERSRTLTPAIRPIKIGGKDYYVGFLHPYQITDMRQQTGNSSEIWYDVNKSAMTGGLVKDNPIFDGSLGIYNGVILHGDARVSQGCNSITPTTVVANARRAVFCGAQAVMLGYGRDNGPERYSWVEELFDYENQLGVAAGCIFGMKKAQFNGTDFATIVMSTYAAAH